MWTTTTRFRSGLSLLLIFFICLSGILVSAETHRPKNVQVALRAKWPGTSLLLEAGELLSKEWNGLYWEFIETWLQTENDRVNVFTAKDCLKAIVNSAKSLLSDPLTSILEFSLTLRSASPRLVLYQQLAEESLSSSLSSYDVNLGDEGISGTIDNVENKNSEPLLVGLNQRSPGGKCCWVDTGSTLFFNVRELQSWLHSSNQLSGLVFQQPHIFEFDHAHANSNSSSPAAILYGALGTECFKEFHQTLAEAAGQGKVKYIVRPVLPPGCESKSSQCGVVGAGDPVYLGGYGVELALKNMEYKAMDDSTVKEGVTLEDPHTEDLSQEVRGFIFSKILERKPELTSEVMTFRDYLLSSTISDTLNVWELKDLGHQTVQRIVHAADPLQSMQEINQNFPSVVSSLSRMKLNDSIKDEIIGNQRMISPGKSLMALNGALINIEDLDIYMLLHMVHQEISLSDQYSKMKIPSKIVRKLLALVPPAESIFRVDFRSSHVHYLNNLEVDPMYKRWRNNINEILMPVFPGQLRYIRKNLFHAVYVLDPASKCGLETIDMMISLFENNLPMRFGIIMYSTKVIKILEENHGELSGGIVENESLITDDVSSLIIRLFMHIKEIHGIQKAFYFLSNINKLHKESADGTEDAPEMHHVEGAFVDTLVPISKSHPQDTLLKLQKDKTVEGSIQESSLFVFKLGLAKLHCPLLMNGLVYDSSEDALFTAMNDELTRIQEQVYYGHINSHTDVLDKFLSENGIQRYNPKIVADGKVRPKFISLSVSFLEEGSVLNDIGYLHARETMDDLKPVTHLLAVDVTSVNGIKLLREGIRYMMAGSQYSRLGVLFNGNLGVDSSGLLFVKVFEVASSSFSHKKKVLEFLDQVCSFYEKEYILSSSAVAESHQAFIDKVLALADSNGFPLKGFSDGISELSLGKLQKNLKKVTQFLFKHFGPVGSVNAIITNGRVTHLDDDGTILSDDLLLLESLEFKQRIKHIMEIIEEVKWEDMDPDMVTSKFISDIIMSISSSVATRERSSESVHFEILSDKYSAVILGNENSSLHIDAIVDPLSPVGQKLSSLLRTLWKFTQPSMRLVFNPLSSLVDLPLKNYYRYVLPTMDDFSGTDYTVYGPKAFFSNMPLSKTLTMNLDVPDPWLVEPVVAVHDLDNILLENLGEARTLSAVFELDALLLTGHCSEKDHEPPRGLQLILGTKSRPYLVDTLVMANLGYWQMKTQPGVWYLQLAPGRSSELYLLKDDGDQSSMSLSKRVTIDDLRGKLVHLEVEKKKGKEHEKLLVPSDDDEHSYEKKKGKQDGWNSNFLKWASGFIGGGVPSKKSEAAVRGRGNGQRQGKTINIFSVASGHLYERFLKIMILSVLKNTHRPLKFWFIKNYLSPQFKDVIPHMAREYGFEYELITYKWPTWLHKQKEKQRIIWAYKILFLDVIFPLSLEKVIFVDADQIVRADMGELYDMNLKGRPLAYTPFCDNNKEMDGYRFWRQGFWKDHLRGKPYHISALYVVDLVKFRETAAGDNLRVVYETLSKDPNSLSNLDQDLPNYAQHNVPIFSLPQEWLWCESWCGNVTKSKAKTIDLCNNPMTKEPKLQGARRIVAEWPDLDMEARRFTAKILGEGFDSQEPIVAPHETNNSIDSNLLSEVEHVVDKYEDLESKAEL